MAGETEQTGQDALLRPITNPEDILIDDYLRIENVHVNPDQAGVTVEVRAETPPDGPSLWKSLRYHCFPYRAPRAYDVVRVIVVVCRDTPPTAEQEAAVLRTPEERTSREQ